jgi:hypothetical protein
MALAKFVAFGSTRSFDSLLITRHGRIVLNAHYARYRPEQGMARYFCRL